MKSLRQIVLENERVSREAEKEHREPRVFDEEEIRLLKNGSVAPLMTVPFLAHYLPPGWRRVDGPARFGPSRAYFSGDNEGYGAYFVDSSGFGKESEPALTGEEFITQVVRVGESPRGEEYGWAVVESGEFQVKVALYEREEGGSVA